MAMEITCNYSNYAANHTKTMKKTDKYYEKLCKKFPNITFHTGSGLMSGNENKAVINLSGQCLEKMANDPEFAKKVEFDLNGVVKAQNNMFAQAKADHAVIHGVTAVMDADGNISVSCSGMTRTSGTKQSSSVMNTEKKQKERLEKKREERKTLEEKAVKKRAEKKAAERRVEKKAAAEERLETGEYTVNITGAGIKTVSGTTVALVASFEAKA